MILKELVDSSLGCYYFGRYHASFLLALCAADATAKRRFPDEKNLGVRFKKFIRSVMPQLFNAKEFSVAVDMPQDQSNLPLNPDGMPDLPNVGDNFYARSGEPRVVRMEGVLWHAFRCALCHEGDLPEVELLPPRPDGAVRVQVDTTVRVSADIIGRLLHVVVTSPENRDLFGAFNPGSEPE